MAGLFGFFDYSKPGKGVDKNEPKRTGFALFWTLTGRKFAPLIQLNMLYILFCLPVVTIGPATAGLVYVLRQFSTETPVFLVSDFWDSFKSNFKQSFVYSLLQAVFVYLMIFSFLFYYSTAKEQTWAYVPLGICVVISLTGIFASFYVYLMIVTLDLKLSAIIKNSFIFAALGLWKNLATLFFVLLSFLFVAAFFPVTIVLIFLFSLSFAGFIICFNSYPVIKKYAIDPYVKKLREEVWPDAKEEKAAAGEGIFSDELKKFPGGR